jgi:hypothetical protein
MNPYLEQSDAWEDFHQRFITHAADVLSGQVGANYLVKVEVRLHLHELPADERRYFGRADVGVTVSPAGEPLHAASEGGVAAPVQLTLPEVEVQRSSSVEIRDRRRRRVVTVIELLSPTNKAPGQNRDEYLGKRNRILAERTHFVEIDLRRGGERPRMPELPKCDYYVLVSRAEDRPRMGMWPIGLRERLPVIPIPLTAPDPDVKLDLQALLHRVYDAAQYGKYIYTETPEPPLSAEDQAWAQQFLPKPT